MFVFIKLCSVRASLVPPKHAKLELVRYFVFEGKFGIIIANR